VRETAADVIAFQEVRHDAKRWLSFAELPEVLTINLKRFSFHNGAERAQ